MLPNLAFAQQVLMNCRINARNATRRLNISVKISVVFPVGGCVISKTTVLMEMTKAISCAIISIVSVHLQSSDVAMESVFQAAIAATTTMIAPMVLTR